MAYYVVTNGTASEPENLHYPICTSVLLAGRYLYPLSTVEEPRFRAFGVVHAAMEVVCRSFSTSALLQPVGGFFL